MSPAILSPADLHLIQRFTGGWTPAIAAEVSKSGGGRAWFEAQLTGKVPDTFYRQSAGWWYANTASTAALVARDKAGTEKIWQSVANYERWVLVGRIHAERQLVECMTQFWEHHLYVPAEADAAQYFRASYGRTIRSLALTSFEKILFAAITHPAMGCFLDNAQSTKKAPNENLGREMLELHTVGRDSGYTENDVKASARILTGYSVDVWGSWVARYDPARHDTKPVKVLGFTHANSAANGQPVAKAYLSYLARHPSTAQRIARKLAVRFVSDEPSQALVDSLAAVYLKGRTAILPVLRTLVASAEFQAAAADPVASKVRVPDEDVVATYRALGARITAPKSDEAAANAILWQTTDLGMRPFGWPRPDGRPDTATAWTSVSRMLASFGMHLNMAGGWWPSVGVSHVAVQSLLPAPKVRFDALVDHLTRRTLGVAATPVMVKAAGQSVGCADGDMITANHAVIRWQMPILLGTLLDTPTHMTR